MHPPRICLREAFTPFTPTGKKPALRAHGASWVRAGALPAGHPSVPRLTKDPPGFSPAPRHNLYTGDPSVTLKTAHL